MKKAIHQNIKNATFSDDSSMREADFAMVGNEMDGVDESESNLDEKMKQFISFN